MWDYLRRSGARGFFLRLTGRVDASVVAALVVSMAQMVMESIENGNKKTLQQLQRILRDDHFVPQRYQDIIKNILVTSFIGSDSANEVAKQRAR